MAGVWRTEKPGFYRKILFFFFDFYRKPCVYRRNYFIPKLSLIKGYNHAEFQKKISHGSNPTQVNKKLEEEKTKSMTLTQELQRVKSRQLVFSKNQGGPAAAQAPLSPSRVNPIHAAHTTAELKRLNDELSLGIQIDIFNLSRFIPKSLYNLKLCRGQLELIRLIT